MALTKPCTIPGGIDVPGAYYVIDGIVYRQFSNSLSFDLVGFRDPDYRQRVRGALADYRAKMAAMVEADATLKAFIPPEGSTEVEIAELVLKSVEPRAKLGLAQAEFNKAQTVVGTYQPLTGQNFTVAVPPHLIPDLLTDGQPDVAKLYGFVKAQPDWQGATGC